MTRLVAVRIDGPVATLRYDSGPGNVLSVAGLVALRRALAHVEADPAVRVIVLAGRRDGFVGPMDPGQALEMSRALPLPRLLHGAAARLAPMLARLMSPVLPEGERWHASVGYLHHVLLFDALERSQRVTIAAIEGPCLGGGLELALCADLRVARDAPGVWLAQPEILAGLVPGFGATQRLARLVGPARALGLQLTGDRLSPAEARDCGLCWAAWPDPTFEACLEALCARLARRSPQAVAGIKRATRAAPDLPLPAGLALERVEVMRAWSGDDAAQGLRRLTALLAAGPTDAAAVLSSLEAG